MLDFPTVAMIYLIIANDSTALNISFIFRRQYSKCDLQVIAEKKPSIYRLDNVGNSDHTDLWMANLVFHE